MKAKSMDDKHAAKMKAEAKLDSAPKPKLRPRYQQAAAGRTKNAYDVQPHLLPWKCSVCKRSRMLLLKGIHTKSTTAPPGRWRPPA